MTYFLEAMLRCNVGNFTEISYISAFLINIILEKIFSALNINTRYITNEVSCLVTPSLFSGTECVHTIAGCDHVVIGLTLNEYNKKYIIDTWGQSFFEYTNDKDISEFYGRKKSRFVNGNIKLDVHDMITFIVNNHKFIAIFKNLMSEIHRVNLDDAGFTDPFEEERRNREAALAKCRENHGLLK